MFWHTTSRRIPRVSLPLIAWITQSTTMTATAFVTLRIQSPFFNEKVAFVWRPYHIPRVCFSDRPLFSSSSSSTTTTTTELRFAGDSDSGVPSKVSVSGAFAVLSQPPLPTNATELQMLSFYHFQPIADPIQTRNDLFETLQSFPGLRGTIYVAEEGVNAQMAVPPENLNLLLETCAERLPFDPFLESPPNLGDVVDITTPTFRRLIVRVRDFVLRDGLSWEDSSQLDWADAGPELSPFEWQESLSKQKPMILDCRNRYESELGTFRGAKPLNTDTFQETWQILENVTQDLPKDQPLAIFCTGGIRCVKVGAYLKQKLGFQNIQRLQHGIIGYQKYIDNHDEQQSLWEGENFLFDRRRSADDASDESSAVSTTSS